MSGLSFLEVNPGQGQEKCNQAEKIYEVAHRNHTPAHVPVMKINSGHINIIIRTRREGRYLTKGMKSCVQQKTGKSRNYKRYHCITGKTAAAQGNRCKYRRQ